MSDIVGVLERMERGLRSQREALSVGPLLRDARTEITALRAELAAAKERAEKAEGELTDAHDHIAHADAYQKTAMSNLDRALAAEAALGRDMTTNAAGWRKMSIDAETARLAAEAKAEGLAKALEEAAEAIEHWGHYASSYLQEKHDWAGDCSRARTALGAYRTDKEPG